MSADAQSTAGTVEPASTHRLAISPNLDALLEHEERIRPQSPSTVPVLLQAAGPAIYLGSANYPVGLPPPPRGHKQSISSRCFRPESGNPISTMFTPANSLWITTNDEGKQPRVASLVTEETSSSSRTNPYINPAPTLRELGHGRELEAIEEAEIEENKRLAGGRDGQVDEIRGRDEEPRPTLRVSDPGDRSQLQQLQGVPQRSHTHTRAVSSLGDKLPNRWKSIVDPFSDDMSRETVRIQSVQSLSSPQTKPNHEASLGKSWRKTGQSRSRRRNLSLTSGNGPQSIGTVVSRAVVDDDLVLDIRRYSSDFIDITNDKCSSRPLNYHVSTHEVSSSAVTNSTTDYCTQPVSAPDPQDISGHSFIEFSSPTTSHFPTTSDMLLFSTDPHTGSSSRTSKASNSKNLFSIPTFKSSSHTRLSRGNSPHSSSNDTCKCPPTTNFLDINERTGLVRKSRKLARVFGETPGGEMLSTQESAQLAINTCCSKEYPFGTLPQSLGSNCPPHRRHSILVMPDELSESFHQCAVQSAACSRTSNEIATDESGAGNGCRSPTSFIDLSDEEGGDEEATSPIIFAPNNAEICSRRPLSPSQLSLYETMTPEQRAEEERRRNREKLAKLHRFLGSRVPADLVLGAGYSESSLPPIQFPMPAEESESRTQWLRRRRSSSAAVLPSWSDDVDRMKEELNDKEKAINVRRAQKMEKVFGVAPPQTLYHTRHSPSPSVPPELYLRKLKSPMKPSFGGFIPPGEVPSPTYQQRNPNRSSYIKHKSRRNDRHSPVESTRRLLSEVPSDCYSFEEETPLIQPSYPSTSPVYHHYQDSLKSLSDILDRDDKESLAELHQYLNDADTGTGSSNREMPLMKDRRLSNASSVKPERRRSLPARTSMTSVASEFSLTNSKPDVSDFQVRRRRAAKLTQFFGVNYRELINDVLESLETGLELERRRGTLRAEEVEDLLERLRKIRTDRKGLF